MSGRVPTSRPSWSRELLALLSLSGPLALSNLTQIAMGTTDIMMLGRLGAEALAAGALGVNLYFMAFIFGAGLLNAAAPLIARDLGRDPSGTEPVRSTVRVALWSAGFAVVPFWGALWFSEDLLLAMGQDPGLAALAGAYVHMLQWALLPAWSFMVLRSFIGALERPVWSLAIGVFGVAINAFANWCLVFGHAGLPAMGIAGSGLATALSNAAMTLALVAVVVMAGPFRRYRLFGEFFRLDWWVLTDFWRLGLPMAGTLSFEVTMFNAAVFLMGLIGAASLAAHSIAIQLASLTFMVPLGIAQAASIRVGRAYGARDRAAVGRAGWTALGLAVGFMATMSLTMLVAPRLLISAFLDPAAPENAEVVGHAGVFLMFAALFQIADGAQTVGAGMLRGLHDARTPMLFALFGYWGVGLPLGVILAFPLGLKGAGIWIGLATGLAVVAGLMIRRWALRDAHGLLRAM